MFPLRVRYMQLRDVADVVEIDRASFIPPWPERSYRHEIVESTCSYMLVLEQLFSQSVNGLRRFVHTLRSQTLIVEEPQLVGYGGLWKIQEEAHISTIASHPDFRGMYYGELVLASMFRRSIHLDAEYIVLEVRASNTIAQNLYRKYGFVMTGCKKNYYRNNNEDAYEMRAELGDARVIARFDRLYRTLQKKINFIDEYSDTPHPRLGR